MTRKIAEFAGKKFKTVKVYFDREWEEYIVKPCTNADTWYYTCDKDDALTTAKHMANI